MEYYRHGDNLGSARLASTPSQTLDSSTAYAPEGENYDSSGTDLSFTGQKQDIVSGQYDFLFREYSPVQGRWWTPDPAGGAGVWPALPGVGLFGAAASPLAPLGPDDVSAESAAAGAEPCAADTGLLASEPGLGSGSGPSGGCLSGGDSQSAAAANGISFGSVTGRSAPNPFAAVNFANPQTWNRYTYVGGTPEEEIDFAGANGYCTAMAAAGLGVEIAGAIFAPEADWGFAYGVSLGLHALGCDLLF